ncbi:MAG: oligosaccharide flippase family protein [Cyanobacteria bacterium P01_A01_bin.84]
MQKVKPLTLRRNFSWAFIGNAIYAACQWGMLVLLAKLGSPEIVGEFTLGLAIAAPVIMFTDLHLRVVQATDAKREYLFGDYLGLRLIGVGVALLIIAAIVSISGYTWKTSLIVLLIGLAKVFESMSDVFYGLIQQSERMDRIAVSLIIKGLLSLLLLSLGMWVSGDILWGILGLILAWGGVFFLFDLQSSKLLLNREPKPRWDFKTLKKLVNISLPLGFVMMLISLNINIPRYFIKEYLGERELGIFAAIAYLMVLGNMLILSLGESASPRLAKYYASGDRAAYCQLLLKLVGIAGILGSAVVLISMIAGKEILTILYKPEYAIHSDIFTWLMIAAAINYVSSFLGYGITAARYFRIQIPLFVSVASISGIVCMWLLPNIGLLGAALALISAAIAQVLFSLGVIFHALGKFRKNAI